MKQLVIPIHAHTTPADVRGALRPAHYKKPQDTQFIFKPEEGLAQGLLLALGVVFLISVIFNDKKISENRKRPSDALLDDLASKTTVEDLEQMALDEFGIHFHVATPAEEKEDPKALLSALFGILENKPTDFEKYREDQWAIK